MHPDNPPNTSTTSRRRHYRVSCDVLATCRLEPGDGSDLSVTVRNLGLGGACLDLPVEAPLPGNVTLAFLPNGPGGPEVPITLTGRVVWTVNAPDGGPNPTGIQFMKMDDTTRRQLFSYLSELMDRMPEA